MVKISSIFVAFLENINFKHKLYADTIAERYISMGHANAGHSHPY